MIIGELENLRGFFEAVPTTYHQRHRLNIKPKSFRNFPLKGKKSI